MIETTSHGDGQLTAADRQLIVDLARGVVGEVASDELALFDQRSRAFLRGRRASGRDPLSLGGTEVLALVTSVALVAAKTAVELLLSRVADAAERKASTALDRLVDRLRRRPKAPSPVATARWRPEDLRDVRDALTAVLADSPDREPVINALLAHLALQTATATAITGGDAAGEQAASR
ncbi:hypothetical protein Cs7R123_27320 [Catellatospora sp. TT07R-123]|uniref:hypothetical protein n=1 Tax=Catellatospora sp. TT07R-123 TaxID=2733863 RepID=UPI001B2AD37D|nr:hypothetical protein [Catellatospora sp. TT07R-123]GHJ45390.1 hypothetical protein Cs7R123_27320 [Catellatospora sp. TT07R-123]